MIPVRRGNSERGADVIVHIEAESTLSIRLRASRRFAGMATATLACALALVAAGCGGSDSRTTGTPTSALGKAVSTVNTTRTPAGTSASGSPGAGSAPTPGSSTSTTPGASQRTTPSTENADATAIGSGVGSVSGGDPSQPRQIVSTIPAPPKGYTPVVDPTLTPVPAGTDPTEVAETPEFRLAIDLDLTTPGIQGTRDINVGDTILAGVYIENMPAPSEGGGIVAFNFTVKYDRTRLLAPTVGGDEPTNRNPDLNQAGLGSGWSCLPAPEGDLDDPGGINGDGDPATGEAFLSCFSTSGTRTGTILLATIEFHAVASGTSALDFMNVAVGAGAGDEVARCQDTAPGKVVPCTGGSVTIR